MKQQYSRLKTMQESQRIAIAFTVNDSYAQHCCVAMASALENNKSEFPVEIQIKGKIFLTFLFS
ncbi:hypothetical protein, partial [Alistipes finegoldii]|uniref:hypothetical protein n=1 Tax=Alistipes finegoldii TaxID=214856 RepID=UPI00241E548C